MPRGQMVYGDGVTTGQPQCKAKSKQSGQRCRRYAHPGFQVCVMHGGKSLIGPANPAYKEGRYSKFIPPRMLEHMNKAVKDPNMLAMQEEIALLDARIGDLLKRVDTGESSQLWTTLRTTWREMQSARKAGDNDQAALKLNQVGDIIANGFQDYAAWDDVVRLVERRRKLVESERKRMIELKMVMTYDEAVVYAQKLIETVRRHIEDRNILNAISHDVRGIVGDYRELPTGRTGGN